MAIVKFDVRFGRMFRVDRTDSGSGQFVSESVDITDSFEAVFDLENVEVGWLRLGPDRAPDTKLVARGESRPEQPSEKHKYGFRVVVKLSRECSGNNEPVRELLGSARDLWFGMDRLLRDYNAEKDKHPGLRPLVALKGPWSGLPKNRLDAGWPARAEAARKSAHEGEARSKLQDCRVGAAGRL